MKPSENLKHTLESIMRENKCEWEKEKMSDYYAKTVYRLLFINKPYNGKKETTNKANKKESVG